MADRGSGSRKLVGCLTALTATLLGAWLADLGVRTALAEIHINRVETRSVAPLSWAQSELGQARRLRPDLADAWRIEAQRLSMDSPQEAERLQRQALALDPRDWRNWENQGMLAYQLGDSEAALQDLKQAAAYSVGFQAHYEIANLAFLLGKKAVFWQQMKAALETAAPQDVEPALSTIGRLMGRHLEEVEGIVPVERTGVAASAVTFLAQHSALPEAAGLWQQMNCASYQRQDCQQAVYALTGGWLQAAQAGETSHGGSKTERLTPETASRGAQQAWNLGVQRGVLANGVRSGMVTGSNFVLAEAGAAFGWHSEKAAMEIGTRDGGEAAVQLNFDGQEPSTQPLLWQWILVQPGQTYEIRFRMRGQELLNAQGLRIRIAWPDGKMVTSIAGSLQSEWRRYQGSFRAPAGAWLLRLQLEYQRPEGEGLLQGKVWIDEVGMAAEPRSE